MHHSVTRVEELNLEYTTEGSYHIVDTCSQLRSNRLGVNTKKYFQKIFVVAELAGEK